MNFLDKLLHGAKGVGAQVNPFDNGQTYGSVQRQTQTTQGQLPQRPIAEHASMPGYAVKANTERIQTIPRMQYMQPNRAAGDYPNRTNYGVPQDNMIDTPNGYVTDEQYNRQAQVPPQPIQQRSNLLQLLHKINRRY